jgi:hypothetical protein
MNTMIEKLKNCFSKKKYRMQTIILDRIIQTNVILDEKAKTFWQYVLNDFDNWRFHHSTVLNFVAIYFVISEIVNAIKKEKSVYQKEKRRNTNMQSINRLRCFETCEKSSLKIDSFTTSWRQWSKSSIIDWKIQKEECEKKRRRRTMIEQK